MPEYSMILATVGLANLEGEALALATVLEADGARAQASQVRSAYISLLAELNAIGIATAKFARQAIRDAEATSRVRPDTGGGGGPRLGDYVGVSDPLPAVEGSVGINNEDILYDNVSWWWTNEEGYGGHIGREIKGFFQPGNSPPGQGSAGQHPLFTPTRAGKKGVIRQPIPARSFVRDGAYKTEAQWHQQVQAAKRRFLTRVQQATAATSTPSRRPGGRRRP